jgi:NADH-ubiquinone oxidoreductase chain 2
MIISCLLFLLLSNAVSLRRDKSILYSRTVIAILISGFLLGQDNLNITPLETGISLYGGLFQATPTSQTFHLFIFLISATILQLTGFYPRKV